jgi:hypothetical protein
MTTRPGFIWSGTEWVAIGQEAIVNPFYYQATAPTTPSTGDIWVESDVDVPSIDPATLVTLTDTQTLTNKTLTSPTITGSGFDAWQSWAPTLSSGWANGNGTWVAAYAQIGKTVHVRGQFTLGSTTTKGNILSCSLPVNSAVAAPQFIFGCHMISGSGRYYGVCRMGGTGVFSIDVQNASSTYVTNTSLGASIPETWVTGNSISFSFSYEGV